MKKGLIIGKGWLGKRLENQLEQSFQLETTRRKSDKENCISLDFDQDISENRTTDYDFIIITIPFGRRNSLTELSQRFQRLCQYIGAYDKQLILLSSTAIYPDYSEGSITETTEIISLKEPYISIEKRLKEQYSQLVILRLGGLMGDDRYMSKYIHLHHPNLTQIVNHIHYKDVCQIIERIISIDKNDTIYHLIAPEHPTKEEVLSYQIEQKIIQSTVRLGKVISSEKVQTELNYTFIRPNPIYFND